MKPVVESALRAATGLTRLVRPVNVLLFAAGCMLGAYLSTGSSALALASTWWAALAATFVGAAANAVNDAFDAGIDLVNRPTRPIPSGQIGVRTAFWAWGLLSVAGILVSFLVSPTHGLIASASTALLFAYSAIGKGQPVVKNVLVAAVVATALPFGALAAGPWSPSLPAAGFAFLVTLAREIVKDVEDIPGDGRSGARTLATLWGAVPSFRVAIFFIGLTTVAAPLPSIVLGYPGMYLLALVPTCALLLAAAAHLAGTSPDAGRASLGLKWAMVFGMLALATAAP